MMSCDPNNIKVNTTNNSADSYNSFPSVGKDWFSRAAPVSSFKHCPMASVWDTFIKPNVMIEVKNRHPSTLDRQEGCNSKSDTINGESYWLASVIQVAGYYVRLRYVGADDSSNDFWETLLSTEIQCIGWCTSKGKTLIPPECIRKKHTDWKGLLVKSVLNSPTLPENFMKFLKESLKSRMKVGMRLECVDKCRLSAIRSATIKKIIGCRLHLEYDDDAEDEEGFWCHQDSPLIHPVGWAQVIGHDLKSTSEYASSSLDKVIQKKVDEKDANWSLFPVPKVDKEAIKKSDVNFQEGMKLEAIDPLNLSTICPATVTKVLRNNYLMVGIDGVMADDGSDWFCYHASSPNILPVGFCLLQKIPLTPPKEYSQVFEWYDYIKETNATVAPVHLFKRDQPKHGFKEGMLLEAVDLMVPKLVCVATIKKVVGRLLRIHFNGWDGTYDQWCDCESPELYPIGWCQMVGYRLEPPKGPDPDIATSLETAAYSCTSSKKRDKSQRNKKRKGNSSA
ncbi:MBT domain-containing protein 1-like [Brevipalpus obovatus]|uniref:MBT domain-containing protein 1-like n=1 Tax=Brevipalpus obovatus TaxID=246614 RepID=UPI003D9E776C